MKIQGSSILIAEDDVEVMGILKNIFSKHFDTIYTAVNGKTAQEIVKKNDPDLVLTDIQMPEASGIELIIRMRADGKNIPIVMISSSQDREDLKKAIKLGVQDFVEKPFKKAEVEMAVYRALEIAVRNNDLPDMVLRFGAESTQVRQQKKLIGLLQAISAQT